MRALLLLTVLCGACVGDTTIFDPMERQPKYRAFSANPLYEDGRAMRTPPEGTVSREAGRIRPEVATGRDASGKILDAFPIRLTLDVMYRGRTKFEIYCGICHGLVGDGYSLVATQMSLRPPPNLHQLHNVSPGHLFQVITEGYGLMPSYAAQLTPEDRWAVAAYVHALRRSQAARLADAPPDIQQKLRAEGGQ
jgi:mono/diheme cytochrome c family protein